VWVVWRWGGLCVGGGGWCGGGGIKSLSSASVSGITAPPTYTALFCIVIAKTELIKKIYDRIRPNWLQFVVGFVYAPHG